MTLIYGPPSLVSVSILMGLLMASKKPPPLCFLCVTIPSTGHLIIPILGTLRFIGKWKIKTRMDLYLAHQEVIFQATNITTKVDE